MKLAEIDKSLGFFIIFLVILSPLGLIIPSLLNAGCAWGEWSQTELKQLLGYVPGGFQAMSDIWHPVLPDYNFAFNRSGDVFIDSIAYVISGAVGVGMCFAVSYFFLKRLSREN